MPDLPTNITDNTPSPGTHKDLHNNVNAKVNEHEGKITTNTANIATNTFAIAANTTQITNQAGQITTLDSALDFKEDAANKGIANGYPELDPSGFLPSHRLPSVTTAKTVGSTSKVPVITVDAKGRITSASEVTLISGGSGGGGGGSPIVAFHQENPVNEAGDPLLDPTPITTLDLRSVNGFNWGPSIDDTTGVLTFQPSIDGTAIGLSLPQFITPGFGFIMNSDIVQESGSGARILTKGIQGYSDNSYQGLEITASAPSAVGGKVIIKGGEVSGADPLDAAADGGDVILQGGITDGALGSPGRILLKNSTGKTVNLDVTALTADRIITIPDQNITLGNSAWGGIGGTLSNQTDLQNALNAKATPADVTAAISAVVDAAPGTLDTLNELAAALGDDANFASTVTNSLANKVNGTIRLTTASTAPASPGNGDIWVDEVSDATSSVTKADIGLANADNTADSVKNVDKVDGFNASATPVAGTLLALDSNARYPASTLGGAWTPYTPTFANLTVGNGTLSGRYYEVGNLVHFTVKLTFGSTTAITGGFPTMTLPFTAQTSTSTPGYANLQYLDAGVAWYYGQNLISSTTVTLTVTNVAGTYPTEASISSTIPFTWGTADLIHVTGWYEKA